MVEALILGLTTGVSCLGHCLPSVTPMLLSGKMEVKQNSLSVSLFLAGRLLGYILFGSIVGIISQGIAANIRNPFPENFPIFLNILMGLFLLVYAVVYNFPKLSFCKVMHNLKGDRIGFFLIGLVSGIGFCPPFLVATANALALGSVIPSVIYFLSFFMGTTLYLLPLFFIPVLRTKQKIISDISRIMLFIIAGYFIIFKGVLYL